MKWLLNTLFRYRHKPTEQELKILADEIAATYNFFRKNRQNFFNNKKNIPIYLLFGPSRFGKTTILSQTGLNLKNIDLQTLNNVVPTKYCSFWFSHDAIYIDTAGTYTKPDIIKFRNDLIWQGFIKLLQKYFGKNSIAGALIILDLPSISQDATLLRKTLYCVRERVYELATFVKKLPLHIIFTKCDRILGFTDFFSDLNNEERTQPFGMAFTTPKEQIDPTLTFEIKFNELLACLNHRVVNRLKNITSLAERLMVKLFPLQLHNLKPILLEALGKIPSGQHILLSGMYFTSSIQDGSPIDFIKPTVLRAFNLQEKLDYELTSNNIHSFFVEDIFKKITVGQSNFKCLNGPSSWFNLNLINSQSLQGAYTYSYALLIMGLIIGGSGLIGLKSSQKNIEANNIIKSFINSSSTSPSFDELYTTIKKLDPIINSYWLTLGMNRIKLISNALLQTYHIAFIQMLISQLETNLNIEINAPELHSNPNKLYDSLRVYLMLGSLNKLNSTSVENWFTNHWLNIYGPDKTDKLQQQLKSILQLSFKIELNEQLISAVRDSLSNLPPTQLLYLRLEHTFDNKFLIINPSIKPINQMYTHEYFNEVYHKTIPNLVNQKIPEHDSTLNILPKTYKIANPNETTKNLKELYLKKYADTWENVINSVPQIESVYIDTAAEALTNLASASSPINRLLQQIITNTDIPELESIFNKNTISQLKSIDTIKLSNLQHQLTQLSQYFSSLAKDPHADEKIFYTVVDYLQNRTTNPLIKLKTFANEQPPLLRNWLHSIIDKSHEALLANAHIYINKMWHTDIVPQYEKYLADKYPVFSDSKENIKLHDFNTFFGPGGNINKFFNSYIKPFVNTNTTNWTWKNFNGKTINFSQETLNVFLRAAIIQKMFYPTKNINPSVRFSLAPVDITLNTQRFTLHLEGQTITATHDDKKTNSLMWPGVHPGLVVLDFIGIDGKYYTSSHDGVWAWLKILSESNLTATNDIKQFNLTFSLDGNSIKYKLTAAEAINPFIPNIINSFRCPDELK